MTITVAQWKSPVSGTFGVAADWSTGIVPGANTLAELTATSQAYTVTSSSARNVAGLVVGASATLSLGTGTFTIYSSGSSQSDATNNGVIDVGSAARLVFGQVNGAAGVSSFLFNTGTVSVSSTGSEAALVFDAPFNSLRGGGTIDLSGNAEIIAGTTAATFRNVDNTITGSGLIGNTKLTLQNFTLGVIDADASALLTLNTGTNVIGNTGTIETTGAGGLTIDSAIDNQGSLIAGGSGSLTFAKAAVVSGGGDITASVAGATIALDFASLSVGGVVSTVAGSTLVVVASTTDTIDSTDLENAGLLSIQNGATLDLNSAIDNTGTIQMAGSSKATKVVVIGNTTLQGTGQLVLGNSANNKIVSNGAQVSLTNRTSTIVGAGTIGDANLRFVNLTGGVVNANGSVALTIVGDSASGESTDYNTGLIETTGSGGLTITGAFGNSGTLAATGKGALTLSGVTSTNGGTIETTAAGASVILKTSAISGGVMTVAAGSTLTMSAGTTDSLYEALYNNGTVSVANGATLLAMSGSHWFNSGTITLSGSSSATTLQVVTPTGNVDVISGGGIIRLAGAKNAIVSNGTAATLRNIDNTIEGSGTIGDANLTFQNQHDGVVNANGSTALVIDTGSNTVFNDGTIASNSAAGLTVNSTVGNDGTLIANLGTMTFTGSVLNAGVADINNSAEIDFAAAAYNDVHFGSGSRGTLRLDNSSTSADAFGGTIYGFSGQDKIDLSDIAYAAGTTTLSFSGAQAGVLSVTDGTHSTTLGMVGPYTTSSFVLASDNHGGTTVTL